MKKYYFLLFITSLLFSSCSKYGYVSLKYPTAPYAVLPENIHNIAIVNRSLVKKENNNAVIDAILTGEVAGSDKMASDECLKGVYDRMNGWRNISIIIPSHSHLYGTGTRQTPEILNWDLVKSICDSSKADALLVLETFDSNSGLLATNVNNQINAVITGNAPPPPNLEIRMNVQSFWRLYDPESKKIIDEYTNTNYLTFNGGGLNIPPPDALPKTAYNAGEQYIERFLPGYYYVKRDMYKRGKRSEKQQFKTAFRKTEVANWEGAMEVWTPLTKSNNRKNAGRACLNMAVACEVLGKTNDAFTWAKKAYEDYGNKLGRDYANKLKYRLNYE
jgi:hypothetical protein